jgi:hypothetical protein
METIQFIGTKNEMENLHLALGISDNDMPRQSETRIYVVDSEEHNTKHLTDDMFMTLAEGLGRVYTLPTFQEEFNYGDVNAFTDVIRIINVNIYK